MPDQVTVTTRKGWGQRIIESIKSVVIGFLLFAASFVVLYWNEGRIDISKVARDAERVDASAAAPAMEGRLVSVTGQLSSDAKLGDGVHLKEGEYLAFERKVEMYAWTEDEESETEREVGGGETTRTTYTYKMEWTSSPEDSSAFHERTGHVNPAKTLDDLSRTVDEARVGVHKVDMRGIDVRGMVPLVPAPDVVVTEGGATIQGEYVYVGQGTLGQPKVGDLRVSYRVMRSGITGTVFGRLSGGTIAPYEEGRARVHYLYAGSHEGALAQMHEEYVTLLWVLRVVGFLMMWIGLLLILGPISVVLDVLPIFGSVSRVAVAALTFLVSAALSLVVMVVSRVFHNPVALVIALALGVAAVYAIIARGQRRPETAVPAPPPPA